MGDGAGVFLDEGAVAAGGDDGGPGRVGGFELRDEAVAEGCAAVDEAGADAVGGVAAEELRRFLQLDFWQEGRAGGQGLDRKSTRLNSSH